MLNINLNLLYKRFAYNNSVIGMFINPFYISRSKIYKGIRSMAARISGGNLLDVGCGMKPYESLFDVNTYIGIDILTSGHDHLTSKVDVFFDGKNIPFDSGYFMISNSRQPLG